MGSTNYSSRAKSGLYRTKSGSSVGSDKEMNGKLRRPKIRRPNKLNDYGLKRIPDYTELAYKEAVGKLRYFLSGNYPPSVRSYGGSPSIKNLDDDEEKKFPYTLTEYRPRPRLTAKYATLYADSLSNCYNYPVTSSGGNVPPTSVPPTTDAGTSPDVVNFIQKQEEYIEQLERESQYCRDELNNLLSKVKEVISENEHLHEAQKNKLISRMFHSYAAGSETDDLDLDDLGDSTGLDSDNKITPSKSRKATKSRSSKLEGPNIVFESRIAELEAQLTQAKINLKKVQDENNENKRKLASGLVDSTCLDGFKRQIDNLQRDKSSLESQISKLKLSLDQKDGELDGKYRRGSDVEHQLREERNNLESEVRRLKDELSKERSKIRELAGEGARRAFQERSAAEQRYNAHFDELQHDLAAQYDNVAKLQLELDRQRREENDLKRELSMKNSAIEELKMELKNKIASLQADLAQANAEKASLEEELAAARLAIERHQRQAKHEANRLNSEIQSLRQRLDRADADLVHSRRENLRLTEQISNLEKELNMKNLTPISPEKKKEKEISSMLENMENKHAKTVAELESMIQSQNSLMEKLTGECRLLTDKLDDANRRHKKELATLQRQIESLGRSLHTPEALPSVYQAHSSHPTSTSGANADASNYRPDNTRSDTTRHAEVTRRDSQLHGRNSRRESQSLKEQQRFNDNIAHSRDVTGGFEDDSIRSYDNGQFSESITPKVTQDYMDSSHVDEPNVSTQEYTKDNSADLTSNASIEFINNEKSKNDIDNEIRMTQDMKESSAHDAQIAQNITDKTDGINDQNHDTSGHYDPNYAATTENVHLDENSQNAYQNQEYEQQYQGSEGQYENYEQYPQYTDPNTQYSDPNAQYADSNAQYADPNDQYADPNAQYADPNAQYADPNAQYADPNTQYAEQYQNYEADPNYQQPEYNQPDYKQTHPEEYTTQSNTDVQLKNNTENQNNVRSSPTNGQNKDTS